MTNCSFCLNVACLLIKAERREECFFYYQPDIWQVENKARQVKLSTQKHRCYHILSHTTVPELCNICCVILQVQKRGGGETWGVSNEENENRRRKKIDKLRKLREEYGT